MRPGPNNEAADPFLGVDISGYDRGSRAPRRPIEGNGPYEGIDVATAIVGSRSRAPRSGIYFGIQRKAVGGFITVQGQDSYRSLHEAASEAYDRFLNDGIERRVIDVKARIVVWPYKDQGTWA